MSSLYQNHFQMLAEYNRLANGRVYETCFSMDEADLSSVQPGFRISIIGLLNHLLIGDRVWMTRFEGGKALSTGLFDVVHAALPDLWDARMVEDRRIELFMAEQDEEFFSRSIRFVNYKGIQRDDPVTVVLPHFFNHQTHHRAQIVSMMKQAGATVPIIDLYWLLRP